MMLVNIFYFRAYDFNVKLGINIKFYHNYIMLRINYSSNVKTAADDGYDVFSMFTSYSLSVFSLDDLSFYNFQTTIIVSFDFM